ncbi:MAG: 2-oxoglutarate dehydrogenase E1 component [Gammaproteobacteria bacterium]|nr:MAG: 2-oxoglutarate dehydrogenase E1 component [Gammaproteobacteria bacterium]
MSMKKMQQQSYLSGGNAAFIEELYSRYLKDESDVDENWRNWFAELKNGELTPDQDHLEIREQMKYAVKHRRPAAGISGTELHQHDAKQVRVLQLINAYRVKGHERADLDPLKMNPIREVKEMTLDGNNLGEADLDTVFNTGSLFGVEDAPLREIIERVEKTYCSTIGWEYMHIEDRAQKRWIQVQIETTLATPNFREGRRNRIMDRIIAAENLEKFLHTRYIGQKRFSLEGGESLIPIVDRVVQQAGVTNTHEVVIGMAHRGRLNVLTNIFGKMPSDLFDEFEGNIEFEDRYNYDVKYHQGFSSDIYTDSGPMHLALAFNPSHLEIVDPVVEGSVRARQRRFNDRTTNDVLPVLVHGDSAFAGQGVVMETFNMCQTRGYKTGGTIHIIVNNQIGFTTSDPRDMRSSQYCTEVARIVQAPIFHVNGDDPEACVFVAEIAVKYRETFQRDVVIDMVCYRRYGHNEADEPAVTQPMMYEKIRKHPRLVDLHAQRLIDEGFTTREKIDAMIADYRRALEEGGAVALNVISGLEQTAARDWAAVGHGDVNITPGTAVGKRKLKQVGKKMLTLPEGFNMHSRVARIMEGREKMLSGELPADWGFAENLAYATLLDDGFRIRLSGQDSERGTFFHRHAALHDQKTGEVYKPLKYLAEDQPRFEVINSFLSEEAVLGFEYGYSSTDPNSLVIWEAQFGDFANGAQVVIDQFISSGEMKWGRLSGLVMLLPHGYEGQGPEHSSARIERYLELCAQHNMRVVQPTLPAQIFHLLRSQMLCGFRKPLVVMTPKSLLRHERAVSPLDDFSKGEFHKVIGEIDKVDNKKVKRLILCSGKIYFKLYESREQHYDHGTVIVRLEQLYPFPKVDLKAIHDQYPALENVVWCQDEPRNQGMFREFKSRLNEIFAPIQVQYAGRISAASPAVGYMALHQKQEAQLVKDAFEAEYSDKLE